MAVILVDFENVFSYGLLGVDMLKPTDILEIFYSRSCEQIRKEYIDDIEMSGCQFKAIKLLNSGRDFLDKYIAVAVGEIYKSGEKEVAIISKDKGFRAVIDHFKAIGVDDFKVIKAENIEKALVSFSGLEDHKRRSIISERSKQVSLDKISAQYRERELIRKSIGNALIDTPYRDKTSDICDFVINIKERGKRKVYTGAMHSFGRDEGRAIYNIIKDAV